MPLPRIQLPRQHTTDRQVNQVSTDTTKVAKTVNQVLARTYVVEEGGAPSDVYSTNDPAWNQVIDSFTTPAYRDSAMLRATNTQPLKAGDVIVVTGRYLFELAAGTVITLRFALNDGGDLISFPRSYINWGATEALPKFIPLHGRYELRRNVPAGGCLMRIQGARNSGTGAAQLFSTSGFTYHVLRAA